MFFSIICSFLIRFSMNIILELLLAILQFVYKLPNFACEVLGGLKWTRTTDLVLIRHAL